MWLCFDVYTTFFRLQGDSISGDVMPRGGTNGTWTEIGYGGTTTRPTANPAYTGPQYEGFFKSEFGCSVCDFLA